MVTYFHHFFNPQLIIGNIVLIGWDLVLEEEQRRGACPFVPLKPRAYPQSDSEDDSEDESEDESEDNTESESDSDSDHNTVHDAEAKEKNTTRKNTTPHPETENGGSFCGSYRGDRSV